MCGEHSRIPRGISFQGTLAKMYVSIHKSSVVYVRNAIWSMDHKVWIMKFLRNFENKSIASGGWHKCLLFKLKTSIEAYLLSNANLQYLPSLKLLKHLTKTFTVTFKAIKFIYDYSMYPSCTVEVIHICFVFASHKIIIKYIKK